MDVFELRNRVISEYGSYVRSFISIRDSRIESLVDRELEGGRLWPNPLIQLNPNFQSGEPLETLVEAGLLHPECLRIFRRKPAQTRDEGLLRLHQHQVEGIRAARAGDHYVLTTGTGSGKSLAYIVPIVDHVLRRGSGRGIQAIVIYPMNALANSQVGELEKFLCHGYPDAQPPVTFRRYTGQESDQERKEIIADPPDVLLTNYVMLELVLTRPWEHKLVQAAAGLRFLVLDELHTYRGRQGADVALLARRVREMCRARELICVGTSATLAGDGSWPEQQREVAAVATTLFGAEVKPERVIGETLQRVTPLARLDDPAFVGRLAERVRAGGPAEDRNGFLGDPLAAWTETALGLERAPGSERLIRARPRTLAGDDGLAAALCRLTGVDRDRCEAALREILLAGYRFRNDADRPYFAFRLHQFVAKGEAVYATLDLESERWITLQKQLYAPDSDRRHALLPLAFCRECGQEYYVVRRQESAGGAVSLLPRELSDRFESDDGEPGFLYLNTLDPWPSDGDAVNDRLPESWLETSKSGRPVVRKTRLPRLPREIFLSPGGEEGAGDLRAHYFRAPFLFCLHCRIAYDAHQTSDYGKLATLGSEGRSTATTVLSLTAIRELRRSKNLPAQARKLLSFTDNRQALAVVRGLDPRARPASHRDVADLLSSFSRRFASGFEAELVRSEWESVIELQGLGSWPEYRRARRTGRGRPLAVRDRRVLWQVFEAVLESLYRRNLYTFSGLCRKAELLLAGGEATSPFDAVVVDEVQDLRPPELRFLRRLTAAAPGRLMVVGDAGQRIYPGGFSLSSLGLEVRGRSRVLRLNYRTTEQIRRAADRLLGAAADDMDGGVEDRRSRSLLRGPEPVLRGFACLSEEAQHAVEAVRAWLDAGLEPEDIGIFARTAKLIERIAEALAAAGLDAHRLKDEGGASQPGIHLGTMHRAKGLEFKAVLAVSCSAGVIPNPRTVSSYGDPVDRQDAEARERSLLYVVMTRARDQLMVTWVGRPSPLLAEVRT